MATDARFERIQKIVPHDNADSLEIAIVSNFPCVVRKGEFKEGDICFYIRDDAKLIGWDEYNAYLEQVKDAPIVTRDFSSTWQWQDTILKYLGSGGRVKSIKLRGKVSMGILLSTRTVCPSVLVFDDAVMEQFNKTIQNQEYGASYLAKRFGVSHWSAPTTGFGALNVKYCGLPEGLAKSDEENWENLPESDLHIGAECLVTKKLDGTSTTVTCYPDGKYEVSSRSMTFNVEDMNENGEENIYTKFTKDAVKAGLWYAKKFNTIIAIRGETCCGSVQKSSYNKDYKLEGFFVYGCEFPQCENFFEKHGVYGSCTHFLNVVKLMNDNGFNVKHVPIVETGIVSKELLSKYNNMSWEWGEGVVINVKVDDINHVPESVVWDYKSKSREYLMKMK